MTKTRRARTLAVLAPLAPDVRADIARMVFERMIVVAEEIARNRDDVLLRVEEFNALAYQLGFCVCKPDEDVEAVLETRGLLLRPRFTSTTKKIHALSRRS